LAGADTVITVFYIKEQIVVLLNCSCKKSNYGPSYQVQRQLSLNQLLIVYQSFVKTIDFTTLIIKCSSKNLYKTFEQYSLIRHNVFVLS
jgi:hypothetical protein